MTPSAPDRAAPRGVPRARLATAPTATAPTPAAPTASPPDRAGHHPVSQLDGVVHQRVRLGLLSVLVEADHAEFTYLRQALELSDGNLNRHLAVLAEAGYVQSHRDMFDRRPRTWVSITPAGRRAFHSELAALQALVWAHQAGDGQGEPGPAGRRQGEPQASRNGPSPEDRP